ncbi:MAG: hypothetical protein ABL958_20170, partial [Bdellovibrionia bacterium]
MIRIPGESNFVLATVTAFLALNFSAQAAVKVPARTRVEESRPVAQPPPKIESTPISTVAGKREPCAVFRLHRYMPAPTRPTGARLKSEINKSADPKQAGLGKIRASPAWRECVLDYLTLDTDRDGTPDWTVFDGENLSNVLVPRDTDLDNDGLENIFDPYPLSKQENSRAEAAARTAQPARA